MRNHEVSNYNTAGPGSVVTSSVAAIIMIVATALFLPPLRPASEFGICFSFPCHWYPADAEIAINTVLIAIAIVTAFSINKKHSFVRGAEAVLPASMAVILASNPINTSYLGSPVFMLIVNLVCLDIMMNSYHSDNATTSMFAVATYLSFGSMVQYAFLALTPVYLVMAVMMKVLRFKETVAFLMGLVAPYWVAFGFGLISPADFRLPHFLSSFPVADGDCLLFILVSLGTLALVGLTTTLNNAMLIYSGNMRVRSINNMINFLGFACLICMIVDFDNFEAYTATFCFTTSVQIANFFAIRRIPHSCIWFWTLLSLFMLYFALMIISCI